MLKKIKTRKLENCLVGFYDTFREEHKDEEESRDQEEERIITSPILKPNDFVATKLMTTE